MAEDIPRKTEDEIATFLTPEEEDALNDLVLHEDEFFLMLDIISGILSEIDNIQEDE